MNGAQVRVEALGRVADREQAGYFLQLLAKHHGVLIGKLEDQRAALARYSHIGDLTAARRKHHVITALESEVRSIDRMMRRLTIRFSPV